MAICMGFTFDEILALRSLVEGAEYRQVTINETSPVFTVRRTYANIVEGAGEHTEVDLGCSFRGYISNQKLRALGVDFDAGNLYDEITKIYFDLTIEINQIKSFLESLAIHCFNDKMTNLGNPFVTLEGKTNDFKIKPAPDGAEWVYCYPFKDAFRPYGTSASELGEHLRKMLPVWWLREKGVIERDGYTFNPTVLGNLVITYRML